MTLVHGRFRGIAGIVPELFRRFELELTFHGAATVQQVMMGWILWIYYGRMGLATVMLLHADWVLSQLALSFTFTCLAFLLLQDLLVRAVVGSGRVMVDWQSLLVVLGTR